MARFMHTFSSHEGDKDGKREAEKDQAAAARMLTNNGMGKTHAAKVEKKAGDWQVNIYER